MANNDEIYVELDEILSKLTAKPEKSGHEKWETVTLSILYFFAMLFLVLALVLDGDTPVKTFFSDVFSSMSTELVGAIIVFMLFYRILLELKSVGPWGQKFVPYLIGAVFLIGIILFILYYGYLTQRIFPNEEELGELYLSLATDLMGTLVLYFSLERLLEALAAKSEADQQLRKRFHELSQKLQAASD